MADAIEIHVEGLDRLIAQVDKLPDEIARYLQAAGEEAAHEILETEGLKRYPPATAANAPGRMRTVTFGSGKSATFRMPYYTRGRGLNVPLRGGGWRQKGGSEKYGAQWTVTNQAFTTTISNRASYAPYLAGKHQARAMAGIGWRKLTDVAAEKREAIAKIFAGWVSKAIKDLGL